MKALGFLLVLLALWGGSEGGGFFKFEDCTGEFRVANVSAFSISPDPVNLRRNMSVNLDMDIFSDLPEDAVLRTRYYKINSVLGVNIDVPIPCLLGKFGSCSFPLCKYLDMFEEQAGPVFSEGVKYGCPVKAGKYGSENIEIPIPDIGAIARLLVSGKYRAELELVWKKKVIACYRIYTHMK